jgi:DNA (cytosine-5)-methyltransferase 1
MGFTFVDLFSGIGGFHLGCAKNNGHCLAACDIDPIARQIYELNYNIQPYNNIKTLPYIKNVDLLCSGFPCQSYSTLGNRKGMKDERGKLFLYLKKYIQETKPTVFLLENVKGLVLNNNGKYFKFILNSLKSIGYNVSWKLLNSKNFGLPQNRPRVYIVGHLNKTFDFTKLSQNNNTIKIKSILDKYPSPKLYQNRFDNIILNPPLKLDSGFILRGKISNYTNMKLFSSDGIVGTLATSCPPDIYDERIKIERHLSKLELLKLQGFPVKFKFPDNFSRTNYVHYLGNAVSVNVIDAIVKEMITQKLL